MSSESTRESLARLREEALADTPARARLQQLFDEGSFHELDAFVRSGEHATGVLTGFGDVNGSPVYAFSQDASSKGGAVGRAHAAKICRIYDLAAKTGTPVVGFFDSTGADVSEGLDALAAYGDILKSTAAVSGVVPQISIVMGTCAGSAALIASGADFVLMTKDAEFFVAPPFLTDPKGEHGAGSAGNASKSGAVSLVAEDEDDAIDVARKLLTLLPGNNLSEVPLFEYEDGEGEPSSSQNAEELVASIADADSVLELSADFGTAAYTAFGTVRGAGVGFVATNKTAAKLSPADCAKMARFVRTCDAFSIPVITLVDTEGFALSASDELSGSVRDMTKLAFAYAEATTVKISVVTGKAFGPAFVTLAGTNANADLTFAWDSASISALAPATAVEFLWRDRITDASARPALEQEYAETEAAAVHAAAAGYVNAVLTPAQTRGALLSALEITAGKRVARLAKKHGNLPL